VAISEAWLAKEIQLLERRRCLPLAEPGKGSQDRHDWLNAHKRKPDEEKDY